MPSTGSTAPGNGEVVTAVQKMFVLLSEIRQCINDDHLMAAQRKVSAIEAILKDGPEAQSSPTPKGLCACVSDDAERCIALRYPEHDNVDDDGSPEKCECSCHYFQGYDE